MFLAAFALSLATDPIAACRDARATEPDRYLAWRCTYMAARKGADWQAARDDLAAGASEADPWAMVVLGHLLSDQGDPGAETSYHEAILGFSSTGYRGEGTANAAGSGRAQARFGLANFLWHRGTSASDVAALLDQALADAEAGGDAIVVATARAQLSRHLWRTGGDFERAWTLAREAELHAFPDGPYQLRLLVLHVLAGVAELTARGDDARAYRARMVSLAAGEGDAYVEATARNNVAQDWLSMPDLAPTGAAEREARLALAAAGRAKNPYARAGALCTLARALGPSSAEAVEAWRGCVATYKEVGAPESAVYGRSGLATALLHTSPREALAEARAAVDEAQAAGADDAAILARIVLGALLLQLGAPGAEAELRGAIEAIEATRAAQQSEAARAGVGANGRLAYDLLAALQVKAGRIEEAMVTTESIRARELAAWIERERATPATEAHPGLDRRAEAGATGSLGRWLPQSASARLGRDAQPGASIGEVQAALGPGEAMVIYQLSPGQTLAPGAQPPNYALVIDRLDARVLTLPPLGRTEAAVQLWTGLVARRDGSEIIASPASLFLDPVAAALGSTIVRVFVVADGPLHNAPVRLGGGASGPREVSVVPSARAWLRIVEGRDSRPPLVLAVADPALPRAVDEAEGVVARLGGTVLSGRVATLATMREALSRHPSVLHFAMHAVVDTARPELSELRLPAGEPLRPGDVMQLDLAGTIVVLSACSSADGRVVSGEGVLGLARAFLAAGASAVVGTRWPVRDSEAAAFVDDFYAALGEGRTVAGAVAAAEIEASSRPRAAKEAWVVVGDGGVVVIPGGTPRSPVPLIAAACLAVATALAYGWQVRGFASRAR